MEPPEAIDMSGQIIGAWQVVEQAPSRGTGARWWVVCLACKTEVDHSGHWLRRQLKRGDLRSRCRECGA